nr:proline-rich receptor-like protein kinase PERK13 [Aegilops tauschii subsp. strangulata]
MPPREALASPAATLQGRCPGSRQNLAAATGQVPPPPTGHCDSAAMPPTDLGEDSHPPRGHTPQPLLRVLAREATVAASPPLAGCRARTAPPPTKAAATRRPARCRHTARRRPICSRAMGPLPSRSSPPRRQDPRAPAPPLGLAAPTGHEREEGRRPPHPATAGGFAPAALAGGGGEGEEKEG